MSKDDEQLILGALDSLGVALAEHSHVWTEGERAIYEQAIKRIKSLCQECADLRQHLENLYQDNCENALIEVSAYDALRQALHEVAPDHPALRGKPPSFGVWSAQRERIDQLEDLLRSACCIALRQGVGTHWGRFIVSVNKLGLNGITARSYRVLPSDQEAGNATN